MVEEVISLIPSVNKNHVVSVTSWFCDRLLVRVSAGISGIGTSLFIVLGRLAEMNLIIFG